MAFKLYNLDDNIKNTLTIDWYPSLLCNYKCSYCFVNKTGAKFKKDDFELFLNFLRNQDKKITLRLLGGEPLIIPEIDYILNELDKIENITTEVVSNGYNLKNVKLPLKSRIEISIHNEYINQKYIDNLINGIIKQNCSKITIVLNLKNNMSNDILIKMKKVVDKLKPLNLNFNLNTIVGDEFDECLNMNYFLDYFELNGYKDFEETNFNYHLSNKNVKFLDVIDFFSKRKNNFKYCICYNAYLKILYNYDIQINCSNEKIGNALIDNIKLDKIKMICKSDYCDEGCFVDNERYFTK